MPGTDAEPVHDEHAPAQAQPSGYDPLQAPVPLRPLPVILDTDPGLGEPGSDVDDGFAIALALRSPELDVRG